METKRESLKDEVERLRISLQGAPDTVELAHLGARYEELEKHN